MVGSVGSADHPPPRIDRPTRISRKFDPRILIKLYFRTIVLDTTASQRRARPARQGNWTSIWTMYISTFRTILVVALLNIATSLQVPVKGQARAPQTGRRFAAASALGLLAGAALPHCVRAEGSSAPVVLTEEEMEARVRRKEELLRQRQGSKATVSALEVRSDFNPEAGDNLRSRSLRDNYKVSKERADALKSMSRAQNRDELCEMLGRGC